MNAERRAAREKVEKWTRGRSFFTLRAEGNHFKVLLKAIKERNDETSLFKKLFWLLYEKLVKQWQE